MEKIRSGVIGVGSMGRHHTRVLAENECIELVGIADTDETRASELADKYRCPYHLDYRSLLEKKLDFVVVAVPTSLHDEVGIAAVESGAHVLIEKPIANTYCGATAISNAAQKARKHIFVGHIERFNPVVDAVRILIDSGRIGEVMSVLNMRIGQMNARIFDVGIVLDLGSHDIDMISNLYSERAESVYCVGKKKVGNFEDHASLMLKFSNGRTGIIELCWLMPFRMRKMLVTGDKGLVYADLITRKIELWEETLVEAVPVIEVEPLKRQLQSVIDTITNGTPPIVGVEDSIYALNVALASVESYKTNSVIGIPK